MVVRVVSKSVFGFVDTWVSPLAEDFLQSPQAVLDRPMKHCEPLTSFAQCGAGASSVFLLKNASIDNPL